MTIKEDITRRIKNDFRENANQANDILKNAIAETDYLSTDRIIRCIIFLSNGNIEDLKKHIKVAVFDPRDIMLWAEYEKLNDGELEYKRLRDFNIPFD